MGAEYEFETKVRIEGMEDLVSITYAAGWQHEAHKIMDAECEGIVDPIQKTMQGMAIFMGEMRRIAVEEYRRAAPPYKYSLEIPFNDLNICAAFHVDIESYVREVEGQRVISPMDCRRIEDAFAAATEPDLEALHPWAPGIREISANVKGGSDFIAGIDRRANRREELLRRRDLAICFFRGAAAFGVPVRA